MKQLLLFTILSITLFTCQEDEVPKACEVENFGLYSVKNATSDDIDVWLNDVYRGEIKEGKTTAYTVTPGTYDLYAEEVSGFFPDAWEQTATIGQCDIKTVTIQN